MHLFPTQWRVGAVRALALSASVVLFGACQSEKLQEGFAPPAQADSVAAAQPESTLLTTSPIANATAIILGLTVAPKAVTLAPGETATIVPTGWVQGGGPPVVPAPVTWTATGGTIASNGVYTAGNVPGTYKITARLTTQWVEDYVAVTITGTTSATLSRIELTPATVSLAPAAKQQFTVTGIMSNGTSQANPAVSWSATGGTISSTGLYTAGSANGTFRVIAASSTGKRDTSVVTVNTTAATITAITLTPATATVASGATRQFSVSATLSNGTTQASPAVTWTATGGTVSNSGLYTAGITAGNYRVIAASANGKRDTSAVSVTAPATITGITLTPASVTLASGATTQFAVSATLSNGSTQSNPAVTWSATGGSISTSGLYTAGNTSGAYRVIATQQGGSRADTSAVTLTAAAPPPPSGPNAMYFNSAESGCGSDGNVLLCDDFEDGTWYEKNCDQANMSGGLLQTDGWCGTIYNNAGLSAGTGRCGNAGFRSNCAATSGVKGSAGSNPTTGNMADHVLANGGSDEVWVRFYTKPMPGYKFGQEKWLTFNAGGAGSGGIRWGNLMFNCGAGGTTGLSTGDMRWHLNPPQDACWRQNQGNDLTWTAGNWYFAEAHMRLNTPGRADGVIELWVDNCGPSGTSCPATPTLRIRKTDVQTDRVSTSEKITSLWFEMYADGPQTSGERLLDQIKVSKVGPIGFMR